MPWYVEFGLWWALLAVAVMFGWSAFRANEPRDDE